MSPRKAYVEMGSLLDGVRVAAPAPVPAPPQVPAPATVPALAPETAPGPVVQPYVHRVIISSL